MSKKDYFEKPKKIKEIKHNKMRWIQYDDSSVEFSPYITQLTKGVFYILQNHNILNDVLKSNNIWLLRDEKSQLKAYALESLTTGYIESFAGPKDKIIDDTKIMEACSTLNSAFFGDNFMLKDSLMFASHYDMDREARQKISDFIFNTNEAAKTNSEEPKKKKRKIRKIARF